jgi:hypothetical protein
MGLRYVDNRERESRSFLKLTLMNIIGFWRLRNVKLRGDFHTLRMLPVLVSLRLFFFLFVICALNQWVDIRDDGSSDVRYREDNAEHVPESDNAMLLMEPFAETMLMSARLRKYETMAAPTSATKKITPNTCLRATMPCCS